MEDSLRFLYEGDFLMDLEERILSVFEGTKPDLMPWFADLTYWYRAMEYRRCLPTKYSGVNGRIRLYRELGCGAHEELCTLPGRIKHYGIKRLYSSEEFRDGTILYEEGYETPLGSLIAVRKFLPCSVSTAYIKYPVSTGKDLKALRYVYRNQDFEPDYGVQYDQMRDWKGLGFVSSLPPRTPFQSLVVVWAGVMNTIRLMMREPEELEETIQVMSEADDPIYEAIRDSPAPGVYLGENITSEVITPSIFRKYHMPYYRRRVAQLHSAKKKIFVHVDGALRGVLPLFEATGVDCVQSVTPAPVGDVALERLRELAGSNIILWGGLPGVYFSRQYSERLLYDMVKRIIDNHMEGHKFILGVADQVPPDGEIYRVRKVTELLEELGRYRN